MSGTWTMDSGTWTMDKMVNNNDLTHTALFRALNLISETRQ